jgi:hypothetical protein
VRRIIAGAMVLLLAAACSSGGDDSSTTTTETTTTLPPSPTTSSLPPRTPTEIDVCALVPEADLAAVLDDAGPGEATSTTPETEGAPPLLSGQCAWPSADDPALELFYLGPTTATSGEQHLQDVLALDPDFVRGGAVLPAVVLNDVPVSFLADADGMVREVAVVKRSALLYLIVNQEVDARDPAALAPYADLIYKALIRAPR